MMTLRILLADDTADNLEVLKTLLTLDGHSLLCCSDGEQALRLIESARPDVAILEIGMPGRTGNQVVAEARSRGFEAVYIGISGWGTAADMERAKAAGFDHFLVKPPDLDALRIILAQIERSHAA